MSGDGAQERQGVRIIHPRGVLQMQLRYDLAGRDRDFILFPVPSEIVTACGVDPNTKRLVRMRLSRGEQLEGFCTITSGTETYIPAEFRNAFRRSEWFECEIIGNETSDAADPSSQ
jgi:hypothetical protein